VNDIVKGVLLIVSLVIAVTLVVTVARQAIEKVESASKMKLTCEDAPQGQIPAPQAN
jgi:hypothetical protein